jgi:hypothetical protein
MAQYDVDWGAVLQDASDNNSFGPIPPDDYDVSVIEAEATTFSSGTTGLKLKLGVLNGPHAGRWLWTNLVMKEGQARQISVRNIQAIGVDPDWLRTQNPSLVQVAEKMVGMIAVATVGTKMYQGEERNEVKNFKRAESAVPDAPSPSAEPAPPAPSPQPATAAASGDGPPRPF